MEAGAVSRLCLSCGMCCNGVLFEIVKLQAGDSLRELEKLGMKINRRKSEPYFKQPCRFLDDCTCTIYTQRPERCRLFECMQIKQLSQGEITEAEAQIKISEAHRLVDEIKAMLCAAGDESHKDSLTQRVERQLTEQSDELLNEKMTMLKLFLVQHFRILGD